MLNRRDFLTAASALPLALYAGTSRGAEQLAADDASTSVTLAFPADVPSWDPGANASAQTLPIHKSVFDTAIELSPDLKIVPGIVTSHRWLDAEGKTLEMTLRDGVTFQNGDAFTSDDLKFSFYDRPQADEKSLAGANWRTTIAGIETPSPTKAVVHFSPPFVSSIGQFLNISGFV